MPALCALARQGASCFGARTVHPSITLPAHASLLRGIDPAVHGILDNTPKPMSDDWPTFLKVARSAGLRTAALLNWAPVNGLVEDSALDVRFFLDGGYGGNDDAQIAAAARHVLGTAPDVAFAYLVSPDLAGHDHGWGSPQYIEALSRSDDALDRVLGAAGLDCAVIVTTDHGGHERDHQQSTQADMETLVVLRAQQVAPLSGFDTASILDIAPTVADLAGFDAAPSWQGASLLGNESPNVDRLLDAIDDMANHSYGERVNMRSHSLQTAANAAASGASDAGIGAALLHDIGHLLGETGAWGLPSHAQVGATYLQQILPAAVVEPIRLHVDAKRYLVATDTDYFDDLSEASRESLEQQGGPHTAAQAKQFAALPWADEAIALRRSDDKGKTPDATMSPVESYRDLLTGLLAQPTPPAQWLRDACRCGLCVDEVSSQHLLDVADLSSWTRVGEHALQHRSGQQHAVTGIHPGQAVQQPLVTHWHSDHRPTRFVATATDLVPLAEEFAETGFALAHALPPEPGQVLAFAKRLGYVRTTNYGELFDVLATPDPNNLAYTNLGLPLHTDNPYRTPVPTVQILHCLQPARSGGGSSFCDGFGAADQLRSEAPDAFRTLTTTPVDFRFADATTDLRARRPLIEVDVEGAVAAINVNHRSMITPSPSRSTDRFYEAYQRFVTYLNSPANVFSINLAAGEVAIFDNRRVLHARAEFDSSHARHLQGCYIDIDALHALARTKAKDSASTP